MTEIIDSWEDVFSIDQGKCKCTCHVREKRQSRPLLLFCFECNTNHKKLWKKNSSGVYSVFQFENFCNFPNQKGSPCDLVVGHDGLHENSYFEFGGDGIVSETTRKYFHCTICIKDITPWEDGHIHKSNIKYLQITNEGADILAH